uniref:Tetratricopeptide repeat protein 25 n=2 Tax=Vespula pensylvanica TaxID=30213 RepID=A0A834NYR0_VESPE|nr:hypothetical protein H0235_009535 [Vespula pensylvanica]
MARSMGMRKEKKDSQPEIFREKILYREWARRFTTIEKYDKAITYFQKAIKSAVDDKDVRLLLGLCKAQFNFCRYSIAVDTAEKCMELDPNNYKVQEMRVGTLYQIGEFCYSLIHAYNGFRQRRMPFELCIYQANEAIETCVGRNTVPDALKRLLPWIKKLQEYREVLIESLTLESDEFEGIDEDQSKFKVNDPVAKEEMYKTKIQNMLYKIYLNRVAIDKEFREGLLEDNQTLESPNKDSSRTLQLLIQESLQRTKLAWAYIETRDLMRLNDEETKLRYLKRHLRVGTTKLPREREVAWVKICTQKHSLKTFRRRLSVASEPLELTWLFHDFSKFLIEIFRFDLARYYAKKARDSAVEAKSEQWILNATHMTMLIEICQNNRNEAKEAAAMAIASAKKLGIDYLVDFYYRALNIIDEVDFERLMITTDGIATRQRLILELMPEELKNDVDFLFRSMEVVPAKRRLSVMPGCKPIDRKFKLPCRRNTILPCPPKDPEKKAKQALLAQYAPVKKRPGFIDLENYE